MTTGSDFDDMLNQAGIKPDKPLYPILMTIMEATEAARTATAGARGLTPEGEAALIDRVAQESASAAEAKVRQMVRRSNTRTVALATCFGLALTGAAYGVGKWDGARTGAQAIEGAAFLAMVAELNDLRALRQHCHQHAYQQAGGTACNLLPIWIRPPIR